MSTEELAAWLALYFIPGVGPKSFSRLLNHDSPVNIVRSSVETLRALGLSDKQVSYLTQRSSQDVAQCLEWHEQDELHHIVTQQHNDYPSLLAQSAGSPPILFVKGNLASLSLPQLAIVGSRSASLDGLTTARQFAQHLVSHQLAITSGLALGVDGYAHDGALQAGGQTIAVLGCGLQTIYPARHRQLASRIIEAQGALVSEFHPLAKPKAAHFPRRNRIISGLSLGVLVVEAAEKSGSLITARYAVEQGREVFALPGSIHNVNARGCNLLIQQGACLVLTIDDIINEVETLLRWSNSSKPQIQNELSSEIGCKEQLPFPQLLANVGSKAIPVDILANRTNIPVQEVMMQLLELELSGHVVAVSGGYILKGRG
ncbi:DNA-processing protein DprA [Vibrio brasiliensis]|uniref:DNA-processing protein DprA n=1 Tax=Vibrio brasiliensis TaxID=170652 RepID=UPI001EFD09FB|nr:DNA-processing protein DprA [Vibrio brasiliensis]MCG9651006.1 DNA-processing protein DprA [Vibrio brasiliensis]